GLCPIAADVLDPAQRGALAPVLDELGLRPAGPLQPELEVGEHLVADIDAKRLDRAGHLTALPINEPITTQPPRHSPSSGTKHGYSEMGLRTQAPANIVNARDRVQGSKAETLFGYAPFKAWSMSAMRSEGCSMPIDSRIVESRTPIFCLMSA